MKIEPLKQFALGGGPMVQIYGRTNGTRQTNWNLTQLHEPRTQFHQDIDRVCAQSLVRTFYAPRPTKFNKRIADLQEFHRCFRFGQANVLTGPDADGVCLPLWHGFLISLADCPTTVIWSTESKKMVVVHSGRDSIICWHAIKHELGRHLAESVIKNALDYFRKESPSNLRFFVTCGIAGSSFLHPTDDRHHGEKNRQMVAWLTKHFGSECFAGNPESGALNLHILIARQLQTYGRVNLEGNWWDNLDTFSHTMDDMKKDFAFWSHRRANGNGDSAKRNLVVVTNTL